MNTLQTAAVAGKEVQDRVRKWAAGSQMAWARIPAPPLSPCPTLRSTHNHKTGILLIKAENSNNMLSRHTCVPDQITYEMGKRV